MRAYDENSATLDPFDRQVSIADPLNGSSAWSLAYRADGQPASIGAPNGNTTTYAYDDAAMLSAETTTNGSTARVEYGWSRNRAGQVVGEQYTLRTDSMIPAIYEYDGIGRLVAFTRDGATTFYWTAAAHRSTEHRVTVVFKSSRSDTIRRWLLLEHEQRRGTRQAAGCGRIRARGVHRRSLGRSSG